MKKRLISIFVLLLVAFVNAPVSSQGAPPGPTIPLEGVDPVALLQGKEVQGKESIAVIRGNMKYIFASEENKAAFEKSPEQYVIQLNNTCARMGPTVRGNVDLWAVHDGKIYLFASDDCKKAFLGNPAKYFEPRREALAPTPDATARAKALLAKAAEAMGGAAKVDGLTSAVFNGTWSGSNGDGEFPQIVTYAFPDRLRVEQSQTVGGIAGTLTFVVAPADQFVMVKRGDQPPQVFRMLPATRVEREKEFRLNPLAIVRVRNAPDFVAVASGAGKVGERPTENVSADLAGLRIVVAMDAATGQILRLSYVDRTLDGFGIIEETYSDFRTVDGVSLPLVTTATFDGKPYSRRSYKGKSIILNAPIGAETFARPPAPPRP